MAVCLLLAFAVFAHGAVDGWASGALETGAALLFLYWAALVAAGAATTVRWTGLHAAVLALCVYSLFQWLLHLTAYPYLTRVELMRLVAYFLIFFLFSQAFRLRRELEGFAWFLLLLGFVVGLVGIAQYLTSSNKVYWIRETPLGVRPFGPYVNRNHFAGLMELLIPGGGALMIFRGVRREQVLFVALLTGIAAAALFLTRSRGGMVVLGFEVALLIWVNKRREAGAKRRGLVGVSVLAVLALVAWLGASSVLETVSRFRASEVTVGRRVSMFKGAARIFLDHPLVGTGLGTLVSVFPRYDIAYDGKVVDHAHNDYIEGLAETGLIGGMCGFAFLFLLLRDALARLREEQGHFSFALHAGALTAACGLLLHSFVDFNLHIPSNAALFLTQAGLAISPSLPASSGASVHFRQRNLQD